MSRMGELGSYFILIFLVIVLFAVSSAPITDYFTAMSSEGGDESSRNTGYLAAVSGEGVDVREAVSSRGITYVEEEVFDEFSENEKVRVIINFKGDVGDLNLDVEGFEKKRELENFFSVELEKTGLVKLVDSLGDEIESIQVDHEFISMVYEAVPKIRADSAWDLGLGLTGKGQTVCVIDTGVDYTFGILSDKYIGGYDFINDDNVPMDDHGHGTYVARIIADVAPDAKIIAVKALGEDGKGYESDIIAAIDYCIENKDLYNISVMSLAISGGSFEGYCDSVLVTKEANFASEQGIFVVAASGNSGSNNLTAPACGTKVTSVGATRMDDSVACFTNINPLLDLLAPGMGETAGGTSISTAVAAGAALLVLENEPLKPMELEYRFRSTGFLIERNGTNYSRIDVHNALNNVVTNVPGGQVGEQSEGNWEEYKPAAACTCSPGSCDEGQWCSPWTGCAPDEFDGDCVNCIDPGQECDEHYGYYGYEDPDCVECDGACQWE